MIKHRDISTPCIPCSIRCELCVHPRGTQYRSGPSDFSPVSPHWDGFLSSIPGTAVNSFAWSPVDFQLCCISTSSFMNSNTSTILQHSWTQKPHSSPACAMTNNTTNVTTSGPGSLNLNQFALQGTQFALQGTPLPPSPHRLSRHQKL